MKNNHFVLALGIAIPLIVVVTLVILLQNNKNLVKTNYDLVINLAAHGNGECLYEKFSIDSNKHIEKNTQNLCLHRTPTNTLTISEELFIVNTDKGTYKKSTFEELENKDIYVGLKSPDGISYDYSYRYYGNDLQYILSFGSARRNNNQLWTINLEKGVWTRKIEVEPIALNSNTYYNNPGILGWIERE